MNTERKNKMPASKKKSPKRSASKARTTCVVVRTFSAGVHVGNLVSRKGKEVVLAKAVRIWRWRGANTLSEMATSGIQSAANSNYTRVSVEVEDITLTEAVEIIKCTAVAEASIRGAGWAP